MTSCLSSHYRNLFCIPLWVCACVCVFMCGNVIRGNRLLRLVALYHWLPMNMPYPTVLYRMPGRRWWWSWRQRRRSTGELGRPETCPELHVHLYMYMYSELVMAFDITSGRFGRSYFSHFRSLSFGLSQDCAKQLNSYTEQQIKQRHTVGSHTQTHILCVFTLKYKCAAY